MNIGEAIRSIVYLQNTTVREIAKSTDVTYQSIYNSCSKDKASMATKTAIKILSALDYKLVAVPKETKPKDDWFEISQESTGVRKILRVCSVCGKRIPRKEYSQVTPAGRVCQECINKEFSKRAKEDND